DEVVVIGYGTARKSDLTGSVARVSAETFRSQPMTQLTDMLTGTVAGFNANQGTTASGGSSMQVRGPKSLNASTNPMIVLDGVIFNGAIADINPADIESIDILKDASSAAVFGARAAAGVVLVTTKKGKTGKPVIQFSADMGMAEPTHGFKPFDAEGYLTFRRDVLKGLNPGQPTYYYDNPGQLPEGVSLEQWRNASNNPQEDNTQEWLGRLRFYPVEVENYLSGETVDWYDEVMQRGRRQNYDLSIGGGAGDIKYYWSLGYQDNEGIVLGDAFSTIRSRLNLDFTVTDWLSVGLNAQFADRDESSVPASLSQMYLMSPYGDMFNEEGEVEWYPNSFNAANPLINYYGQDRLRRINTLFSSMYAQLKLPFGFDYKLSFQPRFQFLKEYNFWSSQTLEGGSARSGGYGVREEVSQYEWIVDNLLHWNRQSGAHSFDFTFLYSAEQRKDWASSLNNQTFIPRQSLGFHGLQFGTNPGLSSIDSRITGDASMARLNYTLMDRYLFTASVRRDGYSAFGIENPRAVFPAAAFAWRISEEGFFNLDFVDQLKLRFSWGRNGNRDIGAYAALAQLASTLYYDGSNVQVGITNSSLANHSLVWEKTESVNVGLDLAMAGNRVDLSVDYYEMTTKDLLMNRLLPEITGFTDITTNLGELGNRGLELTLNTVNVDKPRFGWRSNLVFSFNRNRIESLFGDYGEVGVDGGTVRRELPDYSNEWFPGQALDRIWDYDITGIWQSDEAAAAAAYGLAPGDFKATDVDNNGVYEALQDKQFIGYRQPRYRIGLRNEFSFLGNFSASLFLRAEIGHMGAFTEGIRSGGADTYDRRNTFDFPYWTPENPIDGFTRLNTRTNVFGGGIMMYKPLSFLRVQDVSLSYNLPTALAGRLKTNSVRIFGSVRNLYSFNSWPGWDPEARTPSDPDQNIPMPRTYTLGLNVSL
ncbi:SusC/RagA family TonB-linked outer membrane protein, partial [Parapedobacter tibetensis]|uniref:SusC/RagA family TonB-linked outer membrane protein n=1 Tax=Parapedobacter tibetensis TaxID=2972951 RepID=UPI00214DC628